MIPDDYEMTQAEIAAVMNEWMRRYTTDPTGFDAQFDTVAQFRSEGDEPSYGATCARFMLKLHRELTA